MAIDTDDLSRKTYQAIMTEADKFENNLNDNLQNILLLKI